MSSSSWRASSSSSSSVALVLAGLFLCLSSLGPLAGVDGYGGLMRGYGGGFGVGSGRGVGGRSGRGGNWNSPVPHRTSHRPSHRPLSLSPSPSPSQSPSLHPFTPLLPPLLTLPFYRLFPLDLLASCRYYPQSLHDCGSGDSSACEIYPVDVPLDPAIIGGRKGPTVTFEQIHRADVGDTPFGLDDWVRVDAPSELDYYDVMGGGGEGGGEGEEGLYTGLYTGYDGRDVWNFIHGSISFNLDPSELGPGELWKADFDRLIRGFHAAVSASVVRGIGEEERKWRRREEEEEEREREREREREEERLKSSSSSSSTLKSSSSSSSTSSTSSSEEDYCPQPDSGHFGSLDSSSESENCPQPDSGHFGLDSYDDDDDDYSSSPYSDLLPLSGMTESSEYERRLSPRGSNPTAGEDMEFLMEVLVGGVRGGGGENVREVVREVARVESAENGDGDGDGTTEMEMLESVLLESVLSSPYVLNSPSSSIKSFLLARDDDDADDDDGASLDSPNPLLPSVRLRTRALTEAMDCVQCGRCRMHGKVLAWGLGTAVGVLMEGEKENGKGKGKEKDKRRGMGRVEAASLMQAVGKVGEGVRWWREMEERRLGEMDEKGVRGSHTEK